MLGLFMMVFGRWQLETNLLSLLPASAQTSKVQAAGRALFADKQNQIVILVSGEDATAAYNMLQNGVKFIDEISVIDSPQPTVKSLSEFYLPYRHNFLSQRYLDALDDKKALKDLVAGQLTQLSNPFVSETLAVSPRLNLADYLQETLISMGDVEYHQGVPAIIVGQKIYFISRLQLNVDGFSLNSSKKIAVQLQQLFASVQTTYSVEVHYSGILFHTAESTIQAKQEISLFGSVSMLAVILLLLLVFRSISPLIIALLTVSIAAFYGVTALLLFFEKLHILTLVFAVTLIGIVIDYCFHFFVYSAQSRPEHDDNRSKPITKPLILGFLTTALGYFALIFSPLEMLSQVAVFMIFGLLGALLTVIILLPSIPQLKRLSITSSTLMLSSKSTAFFTQVMTQRFKVFWFLLVILILLFYVRPITFNDDVKLLNSSPKWLMEHERKVAAILKYRGITRIIVKAGTTQKLLERQEQLIEQLLDSQPNLLIKGITKFLPSVKRQRIHFERIKQANQLGQFIPALEVTGLHDPISAFEPLTFEHFAKGPLSQLSALYVAKYYVEQPDNINKDKYSTWLEVSGSLSDANKLWLDSIKHAAIFDKADDFSTVLSLYRQSIMWLLAIGFTVVAVVLVFKFGFKAGAIATFITVSSGVTALIISQLLVGHLNIFNLLAVLLILALAIDYVIFYQEHGVIPTTFLAITLSALSSALVFGMLVFSKTPAVNSFGLTVMIGILTIFVLAPLSSVEK